MKDKKKLIIIIVVAVIAVIGIVMGILFATGTIGGVPEETTTTTTMVNPVIDDMQSATVTDNGQYMSAEEMPKPSHNFKQATANCTVGMNTKQEIAYQAPKKIVDEDKYQFDSASVNSSNNTLHIQYVNGDEYFSVEMFYSSLQFIEANYIGCIISEGKSDNSEYIQSIYNAKHKQVVTSENFVTDDTYKYTATTVTGLKIVSELDYNTDELNETYYYNGDEISESKFFKLYQEVDPAVYHIYNS